MHFVHQRSPKVYETEPATVRLGIRTSLDSAIFCSREEVNLAITDIWSVQDSFKKSEDGFSIVPHRRMQGEEDVMRNTWFRCTFLPVRC